MVPDSVGPSSNYTVCSYSSGQVRQLSAIQNPGKRVFNAYPRLFKISFPISQQREPPSMISWHCYKTNALHCYIFHKSCYSDYHIAEKSFTMKYLDTILWIYGLPYWLAKVVMQPAYITCFVKTF